MKLILAAALLASGCKRMPCYHDATERYHDVARWCASRKMTHEECEPYKLKARAKMQKEQEQCP